LKSRSLSFLVLGLLLSAALSEANTESQRYLRNALHYYEVGNYEKSKGYFIALLSIGTAREIILARRYLRKRELSRGISRRIYSQPVSPLKRSQYFLEKGIEHYQAGDYQGALNYFNAVLGMGNADQCAMAQSYLDKPDLHDLEITQETGRESEIEEKTPPREALLNLSGYLQEETAFRTSTPSQLSKLRSIGYLAGAGQWSRDLSYKVSGRLWYDGVYDLSDHYPKPVSDDQKTDGELRDTYVDISHGNWDARLGKQQIVWGEAVGLFYADVVNAKDLREFVLPDFEFIRIPEWSSDIEYTHEDFHAELVWLPFPEMDKVGRPGSEYAFVQPSPPGAHLAYGPESDPAQSLENSEVGGRLSYRMEGWDFGVFHLRTWDKFPVYTTSVQPGVVTLTAMHPRLTIDGATFSKEVRDIVFKGEFVYNWQKYFQSTDPTNPTGVVPKDYVDYLLGADYMFPNKLDTALQVGQRIIRDYQSDLFQQRTVRTMVTLWLKRPFWGDQLEPEVLLIKDLNSTDVMVQPKISCKLSSHWRVTLGVDLFGGPSEGLFGEFADRNRGYTELRFDF